MAKLNIEIGRFNILEVVELTTAGIYLNGGAEGDILLPSKDVPDDCQIGDSVEAFIYFDSEDRLVATMQSPFAMVGEFTLLNVIAVERVGAFLDWGLEKDLFLPYAEQTRPLKVGQDVLVYIYLDKSNRISASMRLERNLQRNPTVYQEGQEVELLITGKTDLGYKAIIEGRYGGVIYPDEVFQELTYGQRIRGFIKKLRTDGKIDLSLQNPLKTGHRAADDIAPMILERLKDNNGFLPINDKTPADEIHRYFGVSRKRYKIALGSLYRQRLIVIEPSGIRSV
jgi:predicted RNA-binding protein (virulence factor B family)